MGMSCFRDRRSLLAPAAAVVAVPAATAATVAGSVQREGRGGAGPGRGGGGGGVGRWRRIWWVAAAHSVQRRWIWSAAGRGRRRVGRVCAGSGLGACVRVGRARSRVGIKRIFFFENTLCREAQRETGSRQRNRLVSFLQTSFAESQPVRLSAKNLCRGPYGQALGKEVLTFLFFFILDLSFFCVLVT